MKKHLLYFPNHIQQLLMDNFNYFKTARERQKKQIISWLDLLWKEDVTDTVTTLLMQVPFIWRDWIHQNVTVDVYWVSLRKDWVFILEKTSIKIRRQRHNQHFNQVSVLQFFMWKLSATSHFLHRRKKIIRVQHHKYDRAYM